MKFFVAFTTILAVSLAEEAKVVASPLAYGYPYAGLPYAGLPYAGLPYAGLPYAAAPAPVAAAAPAPVAAAAPVVAAPAYAAYAPYYHPGSQFHAQDGLGNLNYGYANINSNAHVVGNTYGGVTGAYSYVDANGKLQQVEYVADAAGFRTADSRLPVAPVYDGVAPTFNPEPLVAPTFNPEPLVAPTFNPEPLVAPVFTGVAPEPVEDTPEVAEAKAAHLALLEAANAPAERKRRDADAAIIGGSSRIISAPTPLIHNPPVLPHVAYPYAGLGYHGLGYHGLGYAGLGYGLGYAGLAGLHL